MKPFQLKIEQGKQKFFERKSKLNYLFLKKKKIKKKKRKTMSLSVFTSVLAKPGIKKDHLTFSGFEEEATVNERFS